MKNEEFIKIRPGDIFAKGEMVNSPDGLHMTDSDPGALLRWVAVKGYGDDWAIYCYWNTHSVKWIRRYGDKVTNEVHIKRCVPCDDEMFKKYRY